MCENFKLWTDKLLVSSDQCEDQFALYRFILNLNFMYSLLIFGGHLFHDNALRGVYMIL